LWHCRQLSARSVQLSCVVSISNNTQIMSRLVHKHTDWSERKGDCSFWSPYAAQVTAHLRSAHAYSFRLHLRTSQGYSPRALLALTNWTEETGTALPSFIHAFVSLNPLRPTGHYTYHQFNIRSAHTVYLCVSCGYEKKNSDYFTVQHWLTGWFL